MDSNLVMIRFPMHPVECFNFSVHKNLSLWEQVRLGVENFN
jgi:hypothetical protein